MIEQKKFIIDLAKLRNEPKLEFIAKFTLDKLIKILKNKQQSQEQLQKLHGVYEQIQSELKKEKK